MDNYTAVTENIYRLTVPFRDIYTTVYILKAPDGDILFDTATYPEDTTMYILPFLKELGVTAQTLKYVFISHNHGDHSGGLGQLMQEFPETCIVSRAPALKETYGTYSFFMPEDNDTLLDVFRVITIPGHSEDSSAILDTRTATLVTGDCLQLHGICGSGDWACNIRFPIQHLEALKKVSKLEISSIYAAHDYYPMGYKAIGREEILGMLNACIAPLRSLRDLILENPALDDAAVRIKFNAVPGLPTIREGVVSAMRAALSKDGFDLDITLT